MNNSDYSIINLLCDGKDSVFMSVNKMVKSLDNHHVTMEEVQSMEAEIENDSKPSGVGAIWAIVTLFVTTFSNYLISSSNSLISVLNTRVSKMTSKEFIKYWHSVGRKILSQVNENISFLNVMSMFIWIGLAIATACWLYFALRKNLINRKRLQALRQYERKLLMQDRFGTKQPKMQSQAAVTIKRIIK